MLVGAATEALANKGKSGFSKRVAIANLPRFVEGVLNFRAIWKRDQTRLSQPLQNEIDEKCFVRAMCLDDVILSEKRKSRPRWKLSKPVVQDDPLEAKGVSVSRCLPVLSGGGKWSG